MTSRYRAAGIAKLEGGLQWLKAFVLQPGNESKIVVFGHHKTVLDACACALSVAGCGFVRLDGETPQRQRIERLASFRCGPDVRAGIVSVTTGGQGIDLSFASTAVFLEIPPDWYVRPKIDSDRLTLQCSGPCALWCTGVCLYIFLLAPSSVCLNPSTFLGRAIFFSDFFEPSI